MDGEDEDGSPKVVKRKKKKKWLDDAKCIKLRMGWQGKGILQTLLFAHRFLLYHTIFSYILKITQLTIQQQEQQRRSG